MGIPTIKKFRTDNDELNGIGEKDLEPVKVDIAPTDKANTNPFGPALKEAEDAKNAFKGGATLTPEEQQKIIKDHTDAYKNWERGQSVKEYLNSVRPPKPIDEAEEKRRKRFAAIGDMAIALSDAITLGAGGNLPKQRSLATPSVMKSIEAERVRRAKELQNWNRSYQRAASDDSREDRYRLTALNKAYGDAYKQIAKTDAETLKANAKEKAELEKRYNRVKEHYDKYNADLEKAEKKAKLQKEVKQTPTAAQLSKSGGSRKKSSTKGGGGGGGGKTYIIEGGYEVWIPKGKKTSFDNALKAEVGGGGGRGRGKRKATTEQVDKVAKRVGGKVIK